MRLSETAAVGSGARPLEPGAAERPEIVDHRFEDPGVEPPWGLLVDGRPRREAVWHHAPGRASAYDPAQGVEDLAQLVGALRGVLSNERQVGGEEGPLLVRNVGRVRLPVRHADMLASRPPEFITRSKGDYAPELFTMSDTESGEPPTARSGE